MTELAVKNLSCGYGSRRVLQALVLEARAGEMLVLAGPNGVGKTTLLRAMARLLKPTSGAVLLHERDVWEYRPNELARQVAMTPQSERRDWPLTVEESVRLGRAPHRGWLLPLAEADHRIVDEALHNTGLSDLRDRAITELSGGEWRRTILARALAQQARVLLLDEPTAGLDLKHQMEILGHMRRLATEQGLVIVLAMHDLNQAAIFCDRIALLSGNALAAVGPVEEVLTEEIICQVFGVQVTVTRHPVYGTPLVAPLVDANVKTAATGASKSNPDKSR